MQADLSWLDRLLPLDTTPEVLRFWLRRLRAIEKLGLRTNDDFSRAEMDGSLAREVQVPVEGHAASATPVSPSAPRDGAVTQSATGDNIVTLCLGVARADGVLQPVEIEVATQLLNVLTGEINNIDLRKRVELLDPRDTDCTAAATALSQSLDVVQRKALVRGLASVAASDGFIHEKEVAFLMQLVPLLGISTDFLEGVLHP